jgi:hypothetical protein
MVRRLILSGALIGATIAGLILVVAAAGARPAGGPIEFFAPATNSPVGPITFAGAVGDFGKALSMDKNGKPDQNGNFVKMTLRYGGFVVDVATLNKISAKTQPSIVDKSTCSFAFSATGPVTLSKGTGRYQGISGTVSVTIHFLGDGPLYTSGAKKGQCNQSNSAQLLAQRGWITGEGSVKFG